MAQYRLRRFDSALENIQRKGLPLGVVCDTTCIMETATRLRAWLQAANISQAEMARRCEYDRGNFHRLLNGHHRPSLALATRIERETSGAIPAVAWMEPAQ